MPLSFDPDAVEVVVRDKTGRAILGISKTTGALLVLSGRSSGGASGLVAASGAICSHQVGPNDALFRVAAHVLVTTATTHSFGVEVAYTDPGGTARVLVLSFTLIAGGGGFTLVANANGAVPYLGVQQVIKAKANTTITIRTAAGGTYTTVNYSVDGFIEQIDGVA